MDYGSLKSFFSISNLKKLFSVLIMLIMIVMIEFVFKFFNPAILEKILRKENKIIDLLYNITNA